MKTIVIKFRFLFEVFLSIILILIYMLEISNRHFLYFSTGECVTTWETIGGNYIVPYKYYGLIIPQKYVKASYGNAGSGSYITTIQLSNDKKCLFIVNSKNIENHAKDVICTSFMVNKDSKNDEAFMITTGMELVGGGTRIERWKGTKNETVIEPFFFFENAYIPIYIVFDTVFFFRYITKASVITNSAQPMKSIVIWLLKIVAETVIVIITIIGTIILLFLIMQYLFTG